MVLEAGTLAGTSTTGAISVAGSGVKSIAPGVSPGQLTVAGGVQWSATTSFVVELNGAAASVNDCSR